MKSRRHQAIGHKKRDAGKAFEDRIDAALTAARQAGIVADFAHTYPGFTMQGRPIKRTVTDFIGALSGGCALAIECKSISTARFYKSEVSERQQEYLDRLWSTGHFAMLALEFKQKSGIRLQYLIPWGQVPWSKAKTAVGVTIEDLRKNHTPMATERTIERLTQKCVSCGGYVVLYTAGNLSCCAVGIPF